MACTCDKPYNGYSNRATWAVCLWLDNDEGLYTAWRRRARNVWSGDPDDRPRDEAIDVLAKELQEAFETDWQALIDYPESLTRDARLALLDVGDLSLVNWREVATTRFDD